MTQQGASDILSLDNPVFKSFMFYGGVLIAKTMFMSFWTARHRISNNALPAPEDYRGDKDAFKKASVRCEPVERVRRAHLNDLENIPMFLLAAILYLFTRPDPFVALIHFRVFTAGRLLHTLGYLNALMPARGMGFMLGMATSVSVIGQTIYFAVNNGYY